MKSKQPIQAYTGLRAEFQGKARNLCYYQLPPEVWTGWHKVSFKRGKETVRFPTLGSYPAEISQEEKLAFVDEYLASLLNSQNLTPPNRRMLPRWRADLNKYRGWLLHRILVQMEQDAKKTKRKPRINFAHTPAAQYIIPEDITKIVDDLYLFHKHMTGDDANIANCVDLKELQKKVKKYQLKYPLRAEERPLVHARYLETGTPEELQNMLPEKWKADEKRVRAPSGSIYNRRGGAGLVAVLPDGTEVIHLKTEEASKAYGSPRWCTTYGYFHDYKEDLVMVLAPNGSRWQIHYKSDQYMDALDSPVNVRDLYSEYPGLGNALLPFWQNAFDRKQNEGYYTRDYQATQSRLIDLHPDIEIFIADRIADRDMDTIQLLLEKSRDRPDWIVAFKKHLPGLLATDVTLRRLSALRNIPELSEEVPQHMATLCDFFRQSRYGVTANLDFIADTPAWCEAAATGLFGSPDLINAHFNENMLALIAATPAWEESATPHVASTIKSRIESGDYKSVLEALPALAKVAEWREYVAPYINSILTNRLMAERNFDPKEVLALAVRIKPWRENIDEKTLQKILDAELALPVPDIQTDPDLRSPDIKKLIIIYSQNEAWAKLLAPQLASAFLKVLEGQRFMDILDTMKAVSSVPLLEDAFLARVDRILFYSAENEAACMAELLDFAKDRPNWVAAIAPHIDPVVRKLMDANPDYPWQVSQAMIAMKSCPDWKEKVPDIKPRRYYETLEILETGRLPDRMIEADPFLQALKL